MLEPNNSISQQTISHLARGALVVAVFAALGIFASCNSDEGQADQDWAATNNGASGKGAKSNAQSDSSRVGQENPSNSQDGFAQLSHLQEMARIHTAVRQLAVRVGLDPSNGMSEDEISFAQHETEQFQRRRRELGALRLELLEGAVAAGLLTSDTDRSPGRVAGDMVAELQGDRYQIGDYEATDPQRHAGLLELVADSALVRQLDSLVRDYVFEAMLDLDAFTIAPRGWAYGYLSPFRDPKNIETFATSPKYDSFAMEADPDEPVRATEPALTAAQLFSELAAAESE